MKQQSKKTSVLLKLVEEHILPLEEKVKDFDPRYMQTFKSDMEEHFQSKIDNIKDEVKAVEIIKAIFEELSSIDIDKVEQNQLKKITKSKRNLIRQDKRVSLFFQLIEETEKIAPMIAFLILNRTPLHILNENIAKAGGVGLDCNELKGEPKAERMADYYDEVSENLYDNYVKMLWEFCQVLQGKTEIKSYDTFGGTIGNLRQHLPKKYHPLIDFEASWYRNAVSHRDRKYQPKSDELLLWNSKGKDNKKISICMNCLRNRTEEKLLIAGIFLQKIQHIYLTKNLLLDGGVMRMSFELIKNIDFSNIDEQKMAIHETKMKQLFSGVEGYKIIRQRRA